MLKKWAEQFSGLWILVFFQGIIIACLVFNLISFRDAGQNIQFSAVYNTIFVFLSLLVTNLLIVLREQKQKIKAIENELVQLKRNQEYLIK